MSRLADRTIDADHRTYERLARLVRELSDEELATPSGVPRAVRPQKSWASS